MINSSESEVRFVIRQSFLNHGLMIFLIALSVPLSIYLSVRFPWAMQPLIRSEFVTIKLPFFAIVPLVIVAKLMHSSRDLKMVFTDDYVLFITGLMSWREKSIRLHYFNIKEIGIDETLYQKLFGLGDLIITAVATQIESAIRMPGVRNARMIKDFINQRMDAQIHERQNA